MTQDKNLTTALPAFLFVGEADFVDHQVSAEMYCPQGIQRQDSVIGGVFGWCCDEFGAGTETVVTENKDF